MQRIEYRSPITKKKATFKMIDYRITMSPTTTTTISNSSSSIPSSLVKQNKNAALIRAASISPIKRKRDNIPMAIKIPIVSSFEEGAVSNSNEDEITHTSKGNLTEEEADIRLMLRTTAQETIDRYVRYKKKANKMLTEAIRCYEENQDKDGPNNDAIAWMRRYSYYQGRTNLMKRVQTQLDDFEQTFQHLASSVSNLDDTSNHRGSNDDDDCQTSINNSGGNYENVFDQLALLRRMMKKKRMSTLDKDSDTVLWQQLHHIVVDKRHQEQQTRMKPR